MYSYICIYSYTIWIFVQIHVYIYKYTCMVTYVYIYMNIYIHMWIHMQIHISSFWKNIYIHLSRRAFNLSGSQPTNVLWLHCLPAYPAVGTQFWCIKHEYRHLLQKNIFPGSILPPQPPNLWWALFCFWDKLKPFGRKIR